MSCKNKNCGCQDNSISMTTNYNNCPDVCSPLAEPCSELYDMKCICYNGPDIKELDIKKGDRLEEILQKLILGITNNACAQFQDPLACTSILNLVATNITTTTLGISFEPIVNAITYRVEYKDTTSLTWLLLTPLVAPTVTASIVGLQPDTVYDIRVYADCGASGCYSLTIRIKTLPTA